MFEEPAESFAAHDFARRERQDRRMVRIGDRERHVAPALVRTLLVIVGGELLHEMPQLFLAADDEVIEALHTKRLDESFGLEPIPEPRKTSLFRSNIVRFLGSGIGS